MTKGEASGFRLHTEMESVQKVRGGTRRPAEGLQKKDELPRAPSHNKGQRGEQRGAVGQAARVTSPTKSLPL